MPRIVLKEGFDFQCVCYLALRLLFSILGIFSGCLLNPDKSKAIEHRVSDFLPFPAFSPLMTQALKVSRLF